MILVIRMAVHPLHPIPHLLPHFLPRNKARPWFSHYYLRVGTYFPGCVCYFNEFYQKAIPVSTFICISLYVTCIRQQSHICSHSAQRRDPGPSVIWTGITIRVCHTGLVMSKMLHVQQSHAIKHVLYYGVR